MRRSVWAVMAAALAVCGLLGVHRVLLSIQTDRAFSHHMTQAELERLIADQRLVASSGILSPVSPAHDGSGHADAGPILNPFIPLDGEGSVMQTPLEKADWLGMRVRERVKGPRGDGESQTWMMKPETLSELDVTILHTLLRYDSWDPALPPGRYHEYLKTAEHPFLVTSSIPNLIDIQTLAKIRLAQGLASGQIVTALQEVRHLARLTLGVEELVASMIGVSLLRLERLGYTRAVELGLMEPDEWRPVSMEVLDAMKRLGLSMVVVSSGWTQSSDAVAQIREAVPSPFSLCGGLRDALVMWNLLYPAWSGLPLEGDLSGQGHALRHRMDSTAGCRLTLVRDELSHPERMNMRAWMHAMDGMGSNRIESSDHQKSSYFWAKVPFVRTQVVFGELGGGGPLAGYNQYRKRQR